MGTQETTRPESQEEMQERYWQLAMHGTNRGGPSSDSAWQARGALSGVGPVDVSQRQEMEVDFDLKDCNGYDQRDEELFLRWLFCGHSQWHDRRASASDRKDPAISVGVHPELYDPTSYGARC